MSVKWVRVRVSQLYLTKFLLLLHLVLILLIFLLLLLHLIRLLHLLHLLFLHLLFIIIFFLFTSSIAFLFFFFLLFPAFYSIYFSHRFGQNDIYSSLRKLSLFQCMRICRPFAISGIYIDLRIYFKCFRNKTRG